MNKLKISWQQFHKDTLELSKQLLKHYPFAGILAVSRGGLIPATIIAQDLNVRLLDTICIKSYNDTTRCEPTVIKSPELLGNGKGWLVIDDLVDSGNTTRFIRELFPEILIATVYAKPIGKPFTDLYAVDIPQDAWVVFPHEEFNEPPQLKLSL